ncbi:PqiC family protein [Lichenicoccus sp.]|uniref:PqiC family protein n=1 Tax=Lichenicoccus sp. TaxID=2781899 RepID=UPI003D0FE3A3
MRHLAPILQHGVQPHGVQQQGIRPARHAVRRRAMLAGMLGAAMPLLLAGCGGSEPSYYTLAFVPGQPGGGGPLSVEVRTPSVAPSLQRDHIVRNDEDYRLRTVEDAAWADALDEMIGRTLALDLSQRLPGAGVFTQGSAISTTPTALVELDVQRFAADSAGRAELQATLSVHRPDSGPAGSRSLHLTRQPDGPGTAALVAALSTLLGQASDQVAEMLRAMPPAPPPA